MSASIVPAYGPAMLFPSSRTRTPSSAAVGTDHPRVEGEQPIGHVGPVELACPAGATFAQAFAKLRRGDEPLERAAERLDVARLDQESGHVPLDDPLVAVDVARDRRGTGGHRLQEDDPERLLAGRGGTEDVGGLVEARLVGLAHPAGEQHVANALLVHEAPEIAQLRTSAADDQAGLGVALLQL